VVDDDDAIRESLADPALADAGIEAHVGGVTATRLDLTEHIEERPPWLVVGVVPAAARLLVVALRSIALPVKAALMDLISVGAAYGVVVAAFE